MGDIVLVRPGGRVPADGEIVDGAAEMDESMVTGESRPVPRDVGQPGGRGTVATDSAVRVRVEAVGEDTALAGIQRLVAEAQTSRSRAQALADRAAALLFYAGLAFSPRWPGGCSARRAPPSSEPSPCWSSPAPHALELAIPLVISISTSLSASNGIQVKDRLALERMRTVDAVVFDKTGTLTTGEHHVSDVRTVDGDEDAMLRERGLEVPEALRADVDRWRGRGRRARGHPRRARHRSAGA